MESRRFVSLLVGEVIFILTFAGGLIPAFLEKSRTAESSSSVHVWLIVAGVSFVLFVFLFVIREIRMHDEFKRLSEKVAAQEKELKKREDNSKLIGEQAIELAELKKQLEEARKSSEGTIERLQQELNGVRSESEKARIHIDKTWMKHYDAVLTQLGQQYGMHTVAPQYRKWPKIHEVDRGSDAWEKHTA